MMGRWETGESECAGAWGRARGRRAAHHRVADQAEAEGGPGLAGRRLGPPVAGEVHLEPAGEEEHLRREVELDAADGGRGDLVVGGGGEAGEERRRGEAGPAARGARVAAPAGGGGAEAPGEVADREAGAEALGAVAGGPLEGRAELRPAAVGATPAGLAAARGREEGARARQRRQARRVPPCHGDDREERRGFPEEAGGAALAAAAVLLERHGVGALLDHLRGNVPRGAPARMRRRAQPFFQSQHEALLVGALEGKQAVALTTRPMRISRS